MAATPAMYDPNNPLLYWFEAQFTSGKCCGCGEQIAEGDQIAYTGGEGNRSLVRRECCGLAAESNGAEFNAFNRGRASGITVMPPGGKRPACTRCFIIHTPAQGDECE
jgi:hypothetical protein